MKISSEVVGLKEAFARLEMTGNVTEGIMQNAAEQMRLLVDDRFANEGPGWDPLSPKTLANRRAHGKGSKILYDSGILANSMSTASTDVDAEVFTNVEYAIVHIEGIGVPVRDPFDIDLSPVVEDIVEQLRETASRKS